MSDDPSPVGALEAASDEHRRIAAERVGVLLLVEQLVSAGGSIVAAVKEVAATSGESERSIMRWRATVRDLDRSEWAAALLPHWTGGRSRSECSDEAWQFFLGAFLRPEQPTYRDAWRRTVDVGRVHGWTVPSEKVLRLRVQRELPTGSLVLRRNGHDKLEALYPAQQRDRTVFHALEAVNADGHRWDVQVRWPDGEIARPMAVVFQDLFSGKILSWRIDRTENASAIRLAFSDMCDGHGIPDECYLDNGRGFASKWMTGQMKHRFRFKIKPEEPTGILQLLGVKVHWVQPYHGQSKPIERCFRDLCDTIARHPSFSGAYTGNSVNTKPSNYGTRTIPLADFIRVVELEIKDHNARRGRANRACGGELSFDEAFEASYRISPIRRVTDQQRQLLLLAAEGLKVREGGIHLLGNQFWAPDLVRYLGKSVVVRFDPEHLQRGVYAYTIKGTFIAFAECSAAVGFADADAAREHNRKRRSWTKAVKKATRELGAIDPSEVGRLHTEALAAKYGETAEPTAKVVRPVFGRGARPETIMTAPPDDLERDDEQSSLLAKVGSRSRRRLDSELGQKVGA